MPESRGPEFPDGPEIPEFTEAELTSVFDDAFVAAAAVREPSADERRLGVRESAASLADVPDPDDDAWSPGPGTAAWHRGVAWVLAVVMGVGVVAMAVTAVHRAGSSPARPQPLPAVGTGTPTPGAEPASFGPAARAG